jgi:hypothetical protein
MREEYVRRMDVTEFRISVYCDGLRENKKVHPRGIEPRSPEWKSGILPLDHGCFLKSDFFALHVPYQLPPQMENE